MSNLTNPTTAADYVIPSTDSGSTQDSLSAALSDTLIDPMFWVVILCFLLCCCGCCMSCLIYKLYRVYFHERGSLREKGLAFGLDSNTHILPSQNSLSNHSHSHTHSHGSHVSHASHASHTNTQNNLSSHPYAPFVTTSNTGQNILIDHGSGLVSPHSIHNNNNQQQYPQYVFAKDMNGNIQMIPTGSAANSIIKNNPDTPELFRPVSPYVGNSINFPGLTLSNNQMIPSAGSGSSNNIVNAVPESEVYFSYDPNRFDIPNIGIKNNGGNNGSYLTFQDYNNSKHHADTSGSKINTNTGVDSTNSTNSLSDDKGNIGNINNINPNVNNMITNIGSNQKESKQPRLEQNGSKRSNQKRSIGQESNNNNGNGVKNDGIINNSNQMNTESYNIRDQLQQQLQQAQQTQHIQQTQQVQQHQNQQVEQNNNIPQQRKKSQQNNSKKNGSTPGKDNKSSKNNKKSSANQTTGGDNDTNGGTSLNQRLLRFAMKKAKGTRNITKNNDNKQNKGDGKDDEMRPRIYSTMSKESGLTDVTFGAIGALTAQNTVNNSINNSIHNNNTINTPNGNTPGRGLGRLDELRHESTEDLYANPIQRNDLFNELPTAGKTSIELTASAISDKRNSHLYNPDASSNGQPNGVFGGYGTSSVSAKDLAGNIGNNANNNNENNSVISSNHNSNNNNNQNVSDNKNAHTKTSTKQTSILDYSIVSENLGVLMEDQSNSSSSREATNATVFKHRDVNTMASNVESIRSHQLVDRRQNNNNNINNEEQIDQGPDENAVYRSQMNQAKLLRELNTEYKVRLGWNEWGSTEITVPASTVRGSVIDSVYSE